MFECRKAKGVPQPEFRECCACHELKKSSTEFYWHRDKNRSDVKYPSGRCKSCHAKWLVEYRSTRKHKYAEYARNALLRKPKKQAVVRIPMSLEQKREKGRLDYQKNKDRYKFRAKEWRMKNPDKRRESRIAYSKTEKGKNIQRDKNRKRRAIILGASLSGNAPITQKWFEELSAFHGHQCYYCFEGGKPITLDHVIPLARGGSHVRENGLPSCKSCNCKKSSKLISEWRPWIDIPIYGLEISSA